MLRIKAAIGTVTLLLGIISQAQDESLFIIQQHLDGSNPELKKSNIGWIVTDDYVSNHNQVRHIYTRYTKEGIEILNRNQVFAIKNGKIEGANGDFKLKNSSILGQHANDPRSTVINSATQLGLSFADDLTESSNARQGDTRIFESASISLEPIPVKKAFFASDKGLKAVYSLHIYPPDQENWWNLIVDAQSGEIIEKSDWVVHCQFDHSSGTHTHSGLTSNIAVDRKGEIFAPFSAGQYNVFAWPLESPNHGLRSVISAPADLQASPYGWHDTNGQNGSEFFYTRGNNVHAYEDAGALNSPGFSPFGGSNLEFNFPFNVSESYQESRSASITNLFYWNNITHDILFKYGFDEPAGNFQSLNYSGQGLGGDYVKAEDEDGSGFNNANFATPPDGLAPRMQMYLWQKGGQLELMINSPASISGSYPASGASFGRSLFNNPVSGELVLVSDGSATPTQGCGNFTNSLTGKIAVIDRGSCNFTVKVKNAQNAGAVAAVIVNNNIENGDELITLGGEDVTITIPAIMISRNSGQIIRNQLTGSSSTIRDSRTFVSSSFDNGIIVHEYGHGVSNRLTGGPSNASCLGNAEQMGEGWSDYLGLMLTMKSTDTKDNARGIGTFAANQPISGRGIRPAPYTPNMNINGFTYADVADEQRISQPHGIGFIWCSMLWDMTWLFIDRYGLDPDIYGGTGGNNIAMQLVMDGMKLQACNPGFVDGRDAILLADRLNYNGANQDIIWQAFANRGLGFSASQGNSFDRFDGEEAFDLPAELVLEITTNPVFAFPGDEVLVDVTITNNYGSSQSNIVVDGGNVPSEILIQEEQLPPNSTYDGSSIRFNTASVGAISSESYNYVVEIDENVVGNKVHFYENNEGGQGLWKVLSTLGSNRWNRSNSNVLEGNFSWHATDPASNGDQLLELSETFTVSEPSSIIIWHKYQTEANFDGGVIEISVDNGNWIDAINIIEDHSYDGNILSGTYNRPAFNGTSNGWVRTKLSLDSFIDSQVKIRFRFLSDESVGDLGWFVDIVYATIGEEVELSQEFCLTSDDLQNQICEELSISVLDAGVECRAFAAQIGSTDLNKLKNGFCLSDFEQIIVTSNYGINNVNSPGDNFENEMILSLPNAPFEIISSNTGNFDVSSLADGEYKIWNLSYSEENTSSTISDFFNENSITTIEQLITTLDSENACAALANKFTDGSDANILKTECVLSADTGAKGLKLYPNPTTNYLSVELPVLDVSELTIQVIDLNGKVVLHKQFNSLSNNTIELPLLSPGIYITNISSGNQVIASEKLVVK